MYYRYEAKYPDDTEWKGIFHCLSPDDRRKWYCLSTPKWYDHNPDTKSRAWFTEHGYQKWHEKMEHTIANTWKPIETRLIKAETLDNIVVKGKTQVIQTI